MNKKTLINENFFFSNIKKKFNIIEKTNYMPKNTEDTLRIFFISSNNAINNFNITNKELILRQIEKKNFNITAESLEFISFINDNELTQLAIMGIAVHEEKKHYESIKNNFAKIISFIQSKKIKNITIEMDQDIYNSNKIEKIIETLQSTLLLKLYHFNIFITNNEKLNFTQFTIDIIVESKMISSIQNALDKGFIIGNAINFSRYLSDLPAKNLYPESFIEIIQNHIKTNNINAEITIFDKEQLKELHMGGILGVGQGSTQTPKLLILKYTPKIQSEKTIALVGKGVTFDTGGISIKPSDGMEDMKSDMSGAASVVSAFIGLSQLESPYTLYAITPLAENMVDGNSIRPGDILTFYNGKTAEIKNTDAEGRLILADALSYSSEIIKPDIMIDLATLTGACRIALGPVYAGLMTENNQLAENIKMAGEISGDKCWSLPLEAAYEPNMESQVADMCNIGTKGYKAGATMGGMFLREFVSKSIIWAHIDIAPVATDCPFKNYIQSFGATGFGVNLLIELLKNTKYIQ